MVRVKICGITNLPDACHAARCGADAIGLVFAKSPRRVDVDTAKKIALALMPRVATVGVFVNETAERMLRIARDCRLTALQLHGDESELTVRRLQKEGFQILKGFRIAKREDLKRAAKHIADALLFDASVPGQHGGTGRVFDWGMLRDIVIERPWFVSGGLNPENVKELLSLAGPYGVDVSSGVETLPGKKNAKLVKEFIQNAKSSR